MPFTPFHMGPALLVKSVVGRRFSIVVFGVSQVCIDVEPLVHIVRRDPTLHGFTHTLPGAFLVGSLAAVLGRPLAGFFLTILRRETRDRWTRRWLGSEVSWPIAFASAYIGTGSHLLLDGVMHGDMLPFWPLMETNPLLGAIGLSTLLVLCVVSGLMGLGILVALRLVAKESDAGGPDNENAVAQS